MKKLLLCRCTLLIALVLGALPALAQWREFPDDAPRGYLAPSTVRGQMILDKKEIRLSPGIQIRDQDNVIIWPEMVKKDAIVKYKLEDTYLHRVWILTPQEIAQPDRYKLPVFKPPKPAKPAQPAKPDSTDKDEN